MASNTGKGVKAIFGILILTLGISLLIPATIIVLDSPTTTGFNQYVGNETTIYGPLKSELTQLDTKSPKDNNSLRIYDTEDGVSQRYNNLTVRTTYTKTFNGQEIKFNITKAIPTDQALVRYTYPTYYSWPEDAKTIYENLVNIILLGAIFSVLGVLILVMEVIRNGY